MFSVVVGVETSKPFLLQTALLTDESDRQAANIEGGFEKTTKKRITLSQEDPGLFGYIVEYLYKDSRFGEEKKSRDTDYVILARLMLWVKGAMQRSSSTLRYVGARHHLPIEPP